MGKIRSMSTTTVIAIPPSFTPQEELETDTTINYLNYLSSRGAERIMSTAGTSQFNLLSVQEIHSFNACLVDCFEGEKIIGIPPLNTKESEKFVIDAEKYIDDKSVLMALYPDRYYGDEVLSGYLRSIREHTSGPIHVHGMVMRSGYGGSWNYKHDVLCSLYEDGVVGGIKEEHSEFKKSYDFIKGLPPEMDVIVAGGSMRRHQYLKSAGANAFLAGIGNLFPEIELAYCKAIDNLNDTSEYLDLETKLFKVFMVNGWHQSLRAALNIMNFTCINSRSPWPPASDELKTQILKIISEIKNEK